MNIKDLLSKKRRRGLGARRQRRLFRRTGLAGHRRRWLQNRKAVRKLAKLIDRIRSSPTIMYDSVTVSEIPDDARAVAGYVNGAFQTFPVLQEEFPNSQKVSIAVTSSADAMCLDVEPGNARPSDAPKWVKRQLERGVKRPIVYASVSEMDEVLFELRAAGIKRSQVRVWTAHVEAGKHRCGPDTCGQLRETTADATQWTWTSQGRNLDESTLARNFFTT